MLALLVTGLLSLTAVPVTGQEPGPGIGTTLNGAYVRMPTFTGTDRLQSIVVLRSDGRLIQAVLGPGLYLDRTTTPATLRITLPTPQVTSVDIIGALGREIIAELPAQTLPAGEQEHIIYTLAHEPVPGSLQLYRDGLRMAEASDYTLMGTSITFTDHWKGTTYARVVAYYRTKEVAP